MTELEDPDLGAVAEWLRATLKDPRSSFAEVVRKSIDEVLDGPRTGRWSFDQLEKTEKTYVGTKIEIVTRTALGLERARFMDLEIAGRPVDVKWSKTSAWQIPREAVGQLCLCIGGLEKLTRFQVGLVRCDPGNLNHGRNQDHKTTLSTVGRRAMIRLVEPMPIPSNFVADMDPVIRDAIMGEPTIQGRVTMLFVSHPGVPIPRNAVRTVARTEGDPMRRVRADTHAGDPLAGYKVLSATYGNKLARVLGYPPLGKDEFMSVPVAEIQRLPLEERARLRLNS
jgi:hypothetical protein